MAVLEISVESATPVATQWSDAVAAAANDDVLRLMRRSDGAQAFYDLGLSTFRSFGAKRLVLEGEGWRPGIALERDDWHLIGNVPVRLRAKFSFSNTGSAGSIFRGFAHDGLGAGITAAGAGLWNVDGIEWWDCRLSNRDPADDGWGSSGTGVIHFQYGTSREVFDPALLRNRLVDIGGFGTYGKNHDHAAYAKTARRLRVVGNLAYRCTGWVVHGYTDCDDAVFEDNVVDRSFGAFVASAGTADSFDGTYRESARNLARGNIIANPDGGPEHGLSNPSVQAMLDHDTTLAADGPNVYTGNALWQGTGTGLLVRTGGSAGRWQDGGGNRTDLEPRWVDPEGGDYRQTADSQTNDYGPPQLRYSPPAPPPSSSGWSSRALTLRGRIRTALRSPGGAALRGRLASVGVPVFDPTPPRTPEWRFELVAFDGEPLAEISPRGRVIRLGLNAAGSASWSFDVLEAAPYRAIMQAGEVDVLVSRDGRRIFRGFLGGVQGGDLTAHGGALSFAATGIAELLADRFVPAGRELAALEQTRMAWQLIEDAQAMPDGDLGIIAGALPDSVARTKAWDAPAPVLAAINELAGLEGGFEWAIEPDSSGRYRFDAFYPRRGEARGVVLEASRNIASVSAAWNAGAGAIATDVAVSGVNQVTVEASDAAARARYRRRERRLSLPDADDATVLGDRATGELREASSVRPSGQLRLLQGAPEATLDSLGLGDVVTVDYRAGWAVFAGLYRITELQVTLPEGEGHEAITATVEPFDGD